MLPTICWDTFETNLLNQQVHQLHQLQRCKSLFDTSELGNGKNMGDCYSNEFWSWMTGVVATHFFYFHPEILGKMNPFWRAYFSKGLKAPTSFWSWMISPKYLVLLISTNINIHTYYHRIQRCGVFFGFSHFKVSFKRCLCCGDMWPGQSVCNSLPCGKPIRGSRANCDLWLVVILRGQVMNTAFPTFHPFLFQGKGRLQRERSSSQGCFQTTVSWV